jgi:hypothetical protein
MLGFVSGKGVLDYQLNYPHVGLFVLYNCYTFQHTLGNIFMLIRSIAIASAVIFTAACSMPQKQDTSGSPVLYKVAKGALIEIDAPFAAPYSSVGFRNGDVLGYFYFDPHSIKCDIHFTGHPSGEIRSGRYEVTKTRQTNFAMGASDFSLTTTLLLHTLSGTAADSIECSQQGSYNDLLNPVTPVTLQQFKHAFGQHLKITLEADRK